MRSNPCFSDLGFAKVDIDRKHRRGVAEAVYCPGKTRQHLKRISRELLDHGQDVLLTKLDKQAYSYLKRSFPSLQYNPAAKLGFILKAKRQGPKGLVLVVCAGTSDIPVAEEAVTTLEVLGNRVEKLYDVGVAGVHRLLNSIELLKKAKVIVVVAGMEGALASLVSGLVACPVVAVPTSTGYGANFQGLSALLTMLNSCSPGITVVNIDNGFGAGYFAGMINK